MGAQIGIERDGGLLGGKAGCDEQECGSQAAEHDGSLLEVRPHLIVASATRKPGIPSPWSASPMTQRLEYRDGVRRAYPDVYSPEALRALEALAPLNRDRREGMAARIE